MHTTSLERTHLMSLSNQRGCIIECQQGHIWLTDDGMDIFLKAGQQWKLRNNRKIVLEAMEPSRVRFRGVASQWLDKAFQLIPTRPEWKHQHLALK